jgi:hypothetical protein
MAIHTEEQNHVHDGNDFNHLQQHQQQQQRQIPEEAVMIRHFMMKGYYGKECKLVISFRQSSSLWLILNVIVMYASVDTIALLPVLILINVLSTWHVLHVFDVFP